MRRWILAIHIWLVAATIPLLDNLLGLRALLAVLSPPRWLRPYRAIPAEVIAQTVRRRLARPWVMKRRRCLRHGLTLFHFLCLAGISSELQIGVFPRQGPRMQAHAWVVSAGLALSDPPEQPLAVVLRRSRTY